MDLKEAINERRSIRRFNSKDVSDKVVLGALDAALKAPSAGNVQDKEFIIIRKDETKKELVSAVFDQVWVARAPVVLVMISDVNKLRFKFKERSELYATIGAGAALQNILLYLTSKGLAGTHVGLFDELAIKRLLDIPEDKRVFSVLVFGYPAEKPPVPYKADLKQITFLESYDKKWVKHKPRPTFLE